MAGKTSKSAWTGFERWIAKFWGTKRTPLSGENSGHGGGDVILRTEGIDALVEAKYRARHAHHTLFKAAQDDAIKHGVSPLHTFLYTRVKGDRGPANLVIMSADTFHALVLPLLLPQLKSNAPNPNTPAHAPGPGGNGRRKRASAPRKARGGSGTQGAQASPPPAPKVHPGN